MPDYKALYLMLFNRITDAIRLLSKGNTLEARCCLMEAQQDAEERYIADNDSAD